MTQPAIRRRKVEMPSGIRKKFTAALSMLLVAAVLMVGSTYAWFTLSTAPEVKGITTSIGANGNLEIALLNFDAYKSTAADLGIVSNVGDSMEVQDKTEANLTWGNLIDLSDESYGLANIILNQAALNITNPTAAGTAADPFIIGSNNDQSILKIARYGSDGRVIDVLGETTSGAYSAGNFTTDSLAAGVRAIGVSSRLNARDRAFNAAISLISTYAGNARNAATTSLSGHGAVLTGMLVTAANAPDENTAIFTGSEVAVLNTILGELQTANGYVFDAAKQAALAYALSNANNKALTDTEVQTLVQDVTDATTEGEVMTALAAAHVSSVPANVSDIFDQYDAIALELSDAADAYADLGTVDTTETDPPTYTYSYSQISGILNAIFNRSYVYVEGYQALGSNKDALADALNYKVFTLHDFDIDVELREHSGVYYDIASAVGNFGAYVQNVRATVSGFTATVNANIATTAPATSLAAASRAATLGIGQYQTNGGTPGTVQVETIGSTYGYALDFGFRTNVAGSTLRLQQAGIQRVYNQTGNVATNEQTLGTGSYFQFTTADTTKFTLAKVKTLAGAIRIVFVTPTVSVTTQDNVDTSATSTYEIVAMAAVDSAATPTDSASTQGGATDTTMLPLALYNFDVTTPADGEVQVTLGEKRSDFDICALEKNVGKKLTAIVYLDGDVVNNTIVANAAQSMSGKINLQFASSATLVPMENAALRNGNASPSDRAKARFAQLVTKEFSPAQLLIINQQVNNGATDWRDKVVAAGTIVAAAGNDDISDDNVTVLNGHLNTIANSAADIATWKTQYPGT